MLNEGMGGDVDAELQGHGSREYRSDTGKLTIYRSAVTNLQYHTLFLTVHCGVYQDVYQWRWSMGGDWARPLAIAFLPPTRLEQLPMSTLADVSIETNFQFTKG